MPNDYPEDYPSKENMLRIVIWFIIFGDGIKVKKLSEIKPPLALSIVGTLFA